MKKIINTALIIIPGLLFSCDNYLETEPLGKATTESFYSYDGVDGLLTGAYAILDGALSSDESRLSWAGSVSNWVWGSVASDDAYKGSAFSDQTPINTIEQYQPLSTNTYCAGKWQIYYDGISRCNDCLKALTVTMENGEEINEDDAIEFEAEAMFLRAWFHFELKRVFDNIPYITDTVNDESLVTNIEDVWPDLENDMQFAVDNLPEKQDEVGRPTKYAAMAVLARIYLFQQNYSAAKPLLDDIISSGKYSLTSSFHDNYKIATNNNEESIFEIQYAVNDGTYNSTNGGWGDALNFPQGGPFGTCCGFHQPSQNLVNAFKVDDNGLPLFDAFNDENLVNDADVEETTPFEVDTDPVDPRLDWTVGRRGIPYLDWGVCVGRAWVRDVANGGPYLYKKNMFYSSEQNSLSTTTGWAMGVNANNYRAYRLAHVYLWRAEVAVEENDLETARYYVNLIRERAGNEVVMGKATEVLNSNGKVASYSVDESQAAAYYLVGQYASFPSQEYARKAVQWELRLEFAMEGHRFFDLVRWG
ncbi:MAG: RagB/SusD family nutrient uptake outer membrane protein, partial [Bacteroidales bacterium]